MKFHNCSLSCFYLVYIVHLYFVRLVSDTGLLNFKILTGSQCHTDSFICTLSVCGGAYDLFRVRGTGGEPQDARDPFSLCDWVCAKEVTGGRGKAISPRPGGRSRAPRFGLWGVRWISHGSDEHLKSQGSERQCFVVFGWQLWELWGVWVHTVRLLRSSSWQRYLCVSEKNTPRFSSVCLLLLSLEKSPRTEQQICPPVFPACDSGWEDGCRLCANTRHPGSLLLPAS